VIPPLIPIKTHQGRSLIVNSHQVGRKSPSKSAVQEERRHLARDLHDGLLQSLTGIALQLETTQRLLAVQETDAARERLHAVQTLILAEQRRLRRFIERLNEPRQTSDDDPHRWDARLRGLGQQIELEWGLPATVSIQGTALDLPAPFAEELYWLVCEALTNSARHGGATQAQAEIAVEPDQIRIRVQDNGRGFACHGRYDLAQLTLLGWGPQSLMGRIAALRGQLTLESSRTGVVLEMTVPQRARTE
jgi:signal transduction histidine kinase